jgi:hypothetical protein
VGEVYPKMVDAMFEATLLTGTVQLSNVAINLAANTTYFTNPIGTVAPLRLRSPYPIRKVSLAGLDQMTPAWQQTTPATQLIAWFPLGTSGYGIYPQLSVESTVVMDFIQSPVNVPRPYTSTIPIPLQEEFTDLVAMYAAAALRAKEAGSEAEEASVVLNEYLGRAKALSLFQGRLDELVMSKAYGGNIEVNSRSVV